MCAASRVSNTLLDPAALTRAETLGLLARKVVEGYRVGDHRSPFNGFAIEFSQHREYSPGDDPRHLDWKILGRADKYYIKQYEQDTNYVAHLLLDYSASMNFASGKLTKLDYARALVACLSLVVLNQRDGVTATFFDDRLRDTFVRTDSPGRIHDLCARLVALEGKQPGRLGACLTDYAARLKARGIVLIVSDLLDDPEEFMQGLRRLALSKSEVIVFQVLDHEELTFPLDGTVKFIGLEESTILQTSPADLRKAYLAALEAHQNRIRKACEQCGAHYTLCDTSRPLAETLSAYLGFRQRC
jgi:uncharacterized protein (DUF58 family)